MVEMSIALKIKNAGISSIVVLLLILLQINCVSKVTNAWVRSMTFLVTVGDISTSLAPQCWLLLLLLTAAGPVSVSQPHQQIHQTCLNTTHQL